MSINVVFDPIVFDVGVFDAVNVVPILLKVNIPQGCRKITPGGSFTLAVSIVQKETTPGKVYPLEPDSGVELALFDKALLEIEDFTAMFAQGDGVYRFQYQTDVNFIPGPYHIKLRAINGDKTMTTPYMKAFEVIDE